MNVPSGLGRSTIDDGPFGTMSLAGASGSFSAELADARHQVGGTATVAPFVVVPAQPLDQLAPAARSLRAQRVEDTAVRIADDVTGDDRVLSVLEDALQRTVGRFLEDLVDLRRRHLLPQLGGQVGDTAVGNRHAQGEA